MKAEDITIRIDNISDMNKLKHVKNEVSELHSQLFDNEILEFISEGRIDNKFWLITITDKRILLSYKALGSELIDISKESIKGISVKNGFIQSELIIEKTNGLHKIILFPDEAKELHNAINCFIHGEKITRPEKTIVEDKKEEKNEVEKDIIVKKKPSLFVKIIKIIFYIILLLFVIGLFLDEEENNNSNTSEDIIEYQDDEQMIASREEFILLFDELLSFKNNPEFHEYGFGRAGKFYIWIEKVNNARDKHEGLAQLKTGLLFSDLLLLGQAYQRSKGKETEYTQEMLPILNKGMKR